MMMISPALVGAYVPGLSLQQPRVQQQSIQMGVESMTGVGPETGDKIFDPLNFATMGNDKTLAFFRHAEIKHGRVAMAATVGLLFHINGIHFSGMLSPTYGVSFEALGQTQIIWTIAGLEHASEGLDPAGHY